MIRMLITDGSGQCPDSSLTRVNVEFIQVREPRLSTRELAKCVQELLSPDGPRILVNDRADVALVCGAAGVHLRDRSISPGVIRRIAPPGFVITVACHAAEDAFRAADEGADYAVLAPIFPPLSKSLTGPALGLDGLREIAARAKIPIFALGGVTAENALLCLEAGAVGVAGITMFQNF